MPLFELTQDGLETKPSSRFATLGIRERQDLQRRLREDISVLGEDLMVIAEEFGEWEDARRRIDLLAIDPDGHLVVIELKRTDDGGHMELQAIRYAAMVSSMGFGEVVAAYIAHCAKNRPDEAVDARSELLEFLGEPDSDDEAAIATGVRIILVSADFGREITTTVLWLNGFEGMDIRCIRLVPYPIDDNRVFVDIQQVIPLPEAADYQVRLRRKEAARERARTATDGRDLTRFHVVVEGQQLPAENKRNAIRVMIDALHRQGIPFAAIRAQLKYPRKLRPLSGLFTTHEEVTAALEDQIPDADVTRWFTSDAWMDPDNDTTWVLFKMWGRDTVPSMTALVHQFPQAKITFRPEG